MGVGSSSNTWWADGQADGPAGPSNPEVVSALWLAHRESRIDDLLAMLRPDVEWYPFTRHSRSMYRGHDGVRLMIDEAAETFGLYWVVLDEVTEPAPDMIRAAARVVRPDPDGSSTELAIRLAIAMRGGLVVRVETYPAQ